jgi:PIN domain nuclease of toxin-antitoxin system
MVSVVSIWEMGMKFRRGKWSEIEAILNDPAGCIAGEGMMPLPVTLMHARAAGLLDWDHGDPFDRMLAAQAIAEDATLVTADRAFTFVPAAAGLRTLWG